MWCFPASSQRVELFCVFFCHLATSNQNAWNQVPAMRHNMLFLHKFLIVKTTLALCSKNVWKLQTVWLLYHSINSQWFFWQIWVNTPHDIHLTIFLVHPTAPRYPHPDTQIGGFFPKPAGKSVHNKKTFHGRLVPTVKEFIRYLPLVSHQHPPTLPASSQDLPSILSHSHLFPSLPVSFLTPNNLPGSSQ